MSRVDILSKFHKRVGPNKSVGWKKVPNKRVGWKICKSSRVGKDLKMLIKYSFIWHLRVVNNGKNEVFFSSLYTGIKPLLPGEKT